MQMQSIAPPIEMLVYGVTDAAAEIIGLRFEASEERGPSNSFKGTESRGVMTKTLLEPRPAKRKSIAKSGIVRRMPLLRVAKIRPILLHNHPLLHALDKEDVCCHR